MSLLVAEYIRRMPYILANPDFESDSYNNCLQIQKCVRDMDKDGLLTSFDKLVLSKVSDGYSYTEISILYQVSRKRVIRTFKSLTDRITFILGEEFSDTGLILRNYKRRT